MSQDYLKLMDRFEDNLYGKLCLKLTPELFYTIPVRLKSLCLYS